jgi:hypothetical protein
MLFFYRVENGIPIAFSVLRTITQRFHLNIITPFKMIHIKKLTFYLREYLLIREYLPDSTVYVIYNQSKDI